MGNERENLRRVGRDEMNLAEFPVALLSERVPQGLKTITFKDRHGTLTVTGSDDYGLPAASDSDVIVALLSLTKCRNDFATPTVPFTRYETLKLLDWEDKGGNYRRLDESLRRWVGVTLRYDGNWWDNNIKCRIDANFHILDDVTLFDREVRRTLKARRQPLPLSTFTWSKRFFESCRAGNLRSLDVTIYFGLRSAVSKQMYRFLGKRFYHRPEWIFDLRELAFEHLGMSRNYTAALLKAKLQPALEELEEIDFLEPLSAADRYTKVARGDWTIRFVHKRPPPAEAKPAEVESQPEPTGLERELVERGVTRGVAAELVATYPEERLRAQIERLDWLRETKPKRVKDLGAYLVGAIREDYAAPAGFEGKAERAARETAARAAHRAGGRGPPGDGPRRRSGTRSRRTGRPCPRSGGPRSTPRRWTRPTPPTARRTRRRHHRSGGCSRPACAMPTSNACWACPRWADPRGRPGRALVAPPRRPRDRDENFPGAAPAGRRGAPETPGAGGRHDRQLRTIAIRAARLHVGRGVAFDRRQEPVRVGVRQADLEEGPDDGVDGIPPGAVPEVGAVEGGHGGGREAGVDGRQGKAPTQERRLHKPVVPVGEVETAVAEEEVADGRLAAVGAEVGRERRGRVTRRVIAGRLLAAEGADGGGRVEFLQDQRRLELLVCRPQAVMFLAHEMVSDRMRFR